MIFKLTGILFLIPVILLVIGAVVITGVVRGLLRMGKGSADRHGTWNTGGEGRGTRAHDTGNSRPPKRKKLFDPDEGEYVDYEEVKD